MIEKIIKNCIRYIKKDLVRIKIKALYVIVIKLLML